MNRRNVLISTLAVIAASHGGAAIARKQAPATWDDLVRVKSKKLNHVYLLPGADFRAYHKVMLDPTEVAFNKNWKRDYNNQASGLSSRVSDDDVQKVVTEGGQAARDIFVKAFNDGGYQVVETPGADVLRLRTAVLNLHVTAPDMRTASRSRSFAGEAGSATLVVEARDSMTGAILGRAVDSRVAGDNSMLMRNSVTNRADFRVLAKRWAATSVDGMNELKKLSPIDAAGGR